MLKTRGFLLASHFSNRPTRFTQVLAKPLLRGLLPPPLPALPEKMVLEQPEQNEMRVALSKKSASDAWLEAAFVPPPAPPSSPPPEVREAKLTRSFSEKGWISMKRTEKPSTLFLAFSLDNGFAVETVLTASEKTQKLFPEHEIQVISDPVYLDTLTFESTIKTIVLLLDLFVSRALVVACIARFLAKGFAVHFVFSESEDAQLGSPATWKGVLGKKYGINKAAIRIVDRLIQIKSIDELNSKTPVGLEMNRLDGHSVVTKDSEEDRMARACKLYESAQSVIGTLVEVYSEGRGIFEPMPTHFRAAVIPHPDLHPTRNKEIFNKDTQDAKEWLLTAIITHKNLRGRLLYFAQDYWRVKSDNRDRSYVFMAIVNRLNKHVILTIQDGRLRIDGRFASDAERSIFLLSFKPISRIIPFYDREGRITGIERTFIDPINAKKFNYANHYFETATGKPIKHKLGMGVHKGSFSPIYKKGQPETLLISEGAENALSMKEAILGTDSASRHLGLSDNFAIWFVMGTNNLIEMPFPSCTRTVIVLVDNDGYNMETQQSLITLTACLLSKGIVVKMVMPKSERLGEKLDLNDVLMKGGPQAVADICKDMVEIRRISELGRLSNPLQLNLHLLNVRDRLKDYVRPNRGLTLLEFATTFFQMGHYEMARKVLEVTPGWLESDGMADTIAHAKALDLLGATYVKLGRYEDALEKYEESLELKLNILCEPLERAKTLCQMGYAHLLAKQYEFALTYFHQYFHMNKTSKTQCPDADCVAFYGLGDVYFAQQKYARALRSYMKGVRIKSGTFGVKNLDVALGLAKIGDVHFAWKEFWKSLQFYDYALTVNAQVFCSENHPVNREILLKMSDVYINLGDYDKARDCSVRGLKIQEEDPSGILKLLMKWKHLQSNRAPSQIMREIARVIKGF